MTSSPPARPERFPEPGQALGDERDVRRVGLRLPDELGLDHVDHEHVTARARGGERRVVVEPEVALEPDDVHVACPPSFVFACPCPRHRSEQ